MYLTERFDAHPHPLIRVGHLPVGSSEEDQSRASQRGRQELKERGLIEHDDLHPFLEDAWTMLCRPPLAVGLAVHAKKGTDFNAVLVEHGRNTIQAYQADGEDVTTLQDIVLSRHEYGGPAGNAVNLLGPIKPGTAGSASVPAQFFDGAGQKMREKPDGNLQSALSAAGIRSTDAHMMNKALGIPRTLEASFTVRAHDKKINRTHKLPFNTQFVGTEEGCYLLQRKPGTDGREWFTVASTDQRKLIGKIEEMTKLLAEPSKA